MPKAKLFKSPKREMAKECSQGHKTKLGVHTMVEGRCMKCKMQVEMKDGKQVTMKNGMMAMKGKCPKCATSVFRIMGKAKK